MLILVLEIFFIFLKNNLQVKVLKISRHGFLYTAYAYYTTFFLKERKPIIELTNQLNIFSNLIRQNVKLQVLVF